MPEGKPIRILYMDDDPGLARMFQKKMVSEGYEVDTAPDGEQGLAVLEKSAYDIVAVDYMMPVCTGLDVIKALSVKPSAPPVVMVTGTGSEEIATQALKFGAMDYIIKDVDGYYLELLPAVFSKVLLNKRIVEEKRAAEEALRDSEEKYRALVECARDGIIMVRDGIITYANQRTHEISGHSRDEIIGRPFLSYIHPQEVEKIAERYKRRMSGRDADTTYETAVVGKDGRKIFVEFNIGLVPIGGKTGLLAVIRDVTERKLAGEEMTRLRHFLQQVIDSMPSAIISVDTDCRITRLNLEAERLSRTPFEQAKGSLVNKLFPQLGEQMEQVRSVVGSGGAQMKDRVPVVIDGEKRFFNIMVYPLTGESVEGAVIRLDDVTALCKIEEMMSHTEKMTSVLGLAAGMAHEINNPLAGIVLGAQNVLRRIAPHLEKNQQVADECGVDLRKLNEYLDRREIPTLLRGMREMGERAGQIIDYMLLFSRGGRSQMVKTDMAGLIDSAINKAAGDQDMIRDFSIQNVRFVKDLAPGVPDVPCNAMEIEQVILNLIKNSAEAVSGRESPTITVRLKSDAERAAIQVEDNGYGMDEAIVKRIFEPFYTTKKVGVGPPGLGLSVAYVIVTNNHGGTISAESEPGKGSTFTLRLPLREGLVQGE